MTIFAELARGMAIATSRERLRTVARRRANPQTPRVKREPLLRILFAMIFEILSPDCRAACHGLMRRMNHPSKG